MNSSLTTYQLAQTVAVLLLWCQAVSMRGQYTFNNSYSWLESFS